MRHQALTDHQPVQSTAELRQLQCKADEAAKVLHSTPEM